MRRGEASLSHDARLEVGASLKARGQHGDTLLDVWSTHLTAAERDAVAELVAAMGDFDRPAGL
jgi:hypothetical protein